MKIVNAIKKLEKVNATIVENTKNTLVASLNGYYISAHINNGSDSICSGLNVRRKNDVSDPMTDYSAGVFYDNLTQAIKSALDN